MVYVFDNICINVFEFYFICIVLYICLVFLLNTVIVLFLFFVTMYLLLAVR